MTNITARHAIYRGIGVNMEAISGGTTLRQFMAMVDTRDSYHQELHITSDCGMWSRTSFKYSWFTGSYAGMTSKGRYVRIYGCGVSGKFKYNAPIDDTIENIMSKLYDLSRDTEFECCSGVERWRRRYKKTSAIRTLNELTFLWYDLIPQDVSEEYFRISKGCES